MLYYTKKDCLTKMRQSFFMTNGYLMVEQERGTSVSIATPALAFCDQLFLSGTDETVSFTASSSGMVSTSLSLTCCSGSVRNIFGL